jgi:hypothetical protein
VKLVAATAGNFSNYGFRSKHFRNDSLFRRCLWLILSHPRNGAIRLVYLLKRCQHHQHCCSPSLKAMLIVVLVIMMCLSTWVHCDDLHECSKDSIYSEESVNFAILNILYYERYNQAGKGINHVGPRGSTTPNYLAPRRYLRHPAAQYLTIPTIARQQRLLAASTPRAYVVYLCLASAATRNRAINILFLSL